MQSLFILRQRLLVAALGALMGMVVVGMPLEGRTGSIRPLTFAKDGTFQISIFEDLHFGESMSVRFKTCAIRSLT